MKICSIVGARPQFIKLAPFSTRIRKRFTEIIIHTGQHYSANMSANFFEDLKIAPPDYNLDIGSSTHGAQTGRMLIEIEKVLLKEKPDMVVIFGDTNSTAAGAIASSKLEIPLTHIEAGLRSFNKSMPEEINRIIADHCSDLLFAPTQTAIKNLKNESLSAKTYLTGDIMLDSLKTNLDIAGNNSKIFQKLGIKKSDYILLTLHRPYNVDSRDNLSNIFITLSRSKKYIIFPAHPRTQKMLKEFDIKLNGNIRVIEPLSYLDFIMLEKNARKIITDSGGIQKEAYLLKIPCITVRPETEWIETVEDGWNVLVGFDSQKLYDAIFYFAPPEIQHEIFGKYSCAEKMVNLISQYFNNT